MDKIVSGGGNRDGAERSNPLAGWLRARPTLTHFWKWRCLAPLSLAEMGLIKLSVGDMVDPRPLLPPSRPFFCRKEGGAPAPLGAVGWAGR